MHGLILDPSLPFWQVQPDNDANTSARYLLAQLPGFWAQVACKPLLFSLPPLRTAPHPLARFSAPSECSQLLRE